MVSMFSFVALGLGVLAGSKETWRKEVTPTQNEPTMLYCRCGMDHSDPYDNQANTACRTIQYENKSQGIDGYENAIFIHKK